MKYCPTTQDMASDLLANTFATAKLPSSLLHSHKSWLNPARSCIDYATLRDTSCRRYRICADAGVHGTAHVNRTSGRSKHARLVIFRLRNEAFC